MDVRGPVCEDVFEVFDGTHWFFFGLGRARITCEEGIPLVVPIADVGYDKVLFGAWGERRGGCGMELI